MDTSFAIGWHALLFGILRYSRIDMSGKEVLLKVVLCSKTEVTMTTS